MNLQDIIAYSLVGIMVIGFIYLAWASRKGKNSIKELKDK
jgi:hypothetical protein